VPGECGRVRLVGVQRALCPQCSLWLSTLPAVQHYAGFHRDIIAIVDTDFFVPSKPSKQVSNT
jgi:hypothetical protein